MEAKALIYGSRHWFLTNAAGLDAKQSMGDWCHPLCDDSGHRAGLLWRGLAAMLFALVISTRVQAAEVAAWGGNFAGELAVPASTTNVVAIYSGGFHDVALRADGTVVVWGNRPTDGGELPGGDLRPPVGLSNVVSVAAGDYFNVALKSDGRLSAWGANAFGQLNNLSNLSNIVAVAAGHEHTLALRADGTIIGVGGNDTGQLDFPAGLNDAVAIAAASSVSLILRSDGTVVKAGSELAAVPPEATNVVAIAAGQYHALALRADRAVVEWGYRRNDDIPRPENLNDVAAIATGAHPDLALSGDGSVVAWGANWVGQANVPSSLSNVVSIAAGYYYSMAQVGGGPPRIIQQPMSFTGFTGGNARLGVGATGTQPLHYQWRRNGLEINSARRPVLALDGLSTLAIGDYDVVVSNALGASTSHVATISVMPSSPMNLTIQAVPTNRIGVLGGTATFTARAQGTPPFSYTWFRDHQVIDDARDQVLRLENLRFADAASYSVAVANSVGSLTSAPVRLSVVNVAAWGARNVGSDLRVFDVPASMTNAVGVSASQWDVLARCKDGRVLGWGDPFAGKLAIPTSATNIVAVAAGGEFSLGLRPDGMVLAWGDLGQGYGILNLPSGLSNVVQIQAAYSWALALQAKGSPIQWGTYIGGWMQPPPPGLSNVVQVSAGARHALALLDDGTVVGWGSDDCNQVHPPQGLSNVVAVVAGDCYSMALREDGTVVEWGTETFAPPLEASNLVAIATGNFHRVGLRDDGKVFSWGFENGGAGQTHVPPDLPPVVAIAAAGDASFGVIPATGEPHIARQPQRQSLFRNQALKTETKLFPGSTNVVFQWFKDGAELGGEISPVLLRSAAQPADSGRYFLIASNTYGIDTSRAAEVVVVNRPPVARAKATPVILVPELPGLNFVVAPNNATAPVILDGSLSSDPDNDLLQYSWSELGGPVSFSQDMVAKDVLTVGSHTIILLVSDGIDTSNDRLALEVVTPAQAVQEFLVDEVQSELGPRKGQSLVATLDAAIACFERNDLTVAVNQLQVFEKKTLVQLANVNPALADGLIQTADKIIEAVAK